MVGLRGNVNIDTSGCYIVHFCPESASMVCRYMSINVIRKEHRKIEQVTYLRGPDSFFGSYESYSTNMVDCGQGRRAFDCSYCSLDENAVSRGGSFCGGECTYNTSSLRCQSSSQRSSSPQMIQLELTKRF